MSDNTPELNDQSASGAASPVPICFFAKHFQRMGLEACAQFLGSLGVGADLTVRPGGFIEPDAVAAELPKAARVLDKHNSQIVSIATGLFSASDAAAEPTFAAMKDLGIGVMWVGHRKTPDAFGQLREQFEQCYRDWSTIAELAVKYDVLATVHNHAGDCMEQDVTMLGQIMDRIDCPNFGMNWDASHATVEGFRSGWKQSLEICAGHVRMLTVKDFAFCGIPKRRQYERPWDFHITPIGDGVTPWQEVFDLLKTIGFKGPMSFHSEYGTLGIPEMLEQNRRDLSFLRPLITALGDQ